MQEIYRIKNSSLGKILELIEIAKSWTIHRFTLDKGHENSYILSILFENENCSFLISIFAYFLPKPVN